MQEMQAFWQNYNEGGKSTGISFGTSAKQVMPSVCHICVFV